VSGFSGAVNFKTSHLYYSRFLGLLNFGVPFENPKRVYSIINGLSIANIVACLLVILCVDVYGIIKYSWGNQFYIIIIETACLSLFLVILQAAEFINTKNPADPYRKVKDLSQLLDNSIYDKLDDELKKKWGEKQNLKEIIERVKYNRLEQDASVVGAQQPDKIEGSGRKLKRSESAGELGRREKELDDRMIITDPMAHQDVEPSFLNEIEKPDKEHPNNVIAVPRKGPAKKVDKNKLRTKVVQTGDKVQTGEEYEKELLLRQSQELE